MLNVRKNRPPITAVVIPCYRVSEHIIPLLERIGPEVQRIYVVDDGCPDRTGDIVKSHSTDVRVKVLKMGTNSGVGGAVLHGYRQAALEGADIIVKLDGDGQMNPALIPDFIEPIVTGRADYTKGNRFFTLESLEQMPAVRIIGNAGLSFLTKATSGYWHLMDPTNGYTAIHASVLGLLPLEKIDRRYFFESDMLFRLNTVRAVVVEVPMDARYGAEKSNLRISQVLLDFPRKHLTRFFKRIFYTYFLRDFNMCSLQLVIGALLCLWGSIFGMYHWYQSSAYNVPATTGTVMLAALPVILGFQLLLSALAFDVVNIPKHPLQLLIGRRRTIGTTGEQSASDLKEEQASQTGS